MPSSSEVNKIFFDLLHSFAGLDGSYDEIESTIIGNILKSKDLPDQPDFNVNNANECMEIFVSRINSLMDLDEGDARQILFDLLESLIILADSDERLHTNESKAIKIIKDKLGIELETSKKIPFTKEQTEILDRDINSKLALSAPPGSGKTTLISESVHKFLELDDVTPNNLLLLSFTKNAVQEMSLSILANSIGAYPYGINISTLDKQAFHLNRDFQDERGYGSYEDSLDHFLAALKDENSVINTWLDDLDHIFIDEAQDIFGVRKEVCLEIIKSRRHNTGFSVFGDPDQQIFDWDFEGEPSLLDEVKELSDFSIKNLGTIHRTDNQEILELISNVRASMEITNKKLLVDLAKADRSDYFESTFNHHFLFRTNAELFRAIESRLSLAAIQNVSFRFQGKENYPDYFQPWVGEIVQLISCNPDNYNEQAFSNDFDNLPARFTLYRNKRHCWEYLKEIGRFDDNNLSLPILLENLTTKKNFKLKNIDFGSLGPKFTTIHGAKGSQSDIVLLKTWKDALKEIKILLVGVSRAKHEIKRLDDNEKIIYKKGAFVARDGKSYQRFFRRAEKGITHNRVNPNPMFFVEMGLKDDYQQQSIVASDIALTEIERTQSFLRKSLGRKIVCTLDFESGTQQYRVSMKDVDTRETYFGGSFSRQLTDALMSMTKNEYKHGYEIPQKISGIVLIDVAAEIYNPEYHEKIHEEYKRKKAWLYPILYSLGPVKMIKK